MSDISQFDGLATVLSTILALFITWSCICKINRMNHRTRFTVRLAYILLATGAIGVAMYPVWFTTDIKCHELILLFAIALVAFDKWQIHKKAGPRIHRPS